MNKKIEISVIQVDRHYEIAIWQDKEMVGDPEWIWGWNCAVDRAKEIAKDYPGSMIYRPFFGKKQPIS